MMIDIAEHLMDAVEELPDDPLEFYSDGEQRLPKHQLPRPVNPDLTIPDPEKQ